MNDAGGVVLNSEAACASGHAGPKVKRPLVKTSAHVNSIKESVEKMSGHYVVAGGTKGIGLSIVEMLRSHAERIDVYARNQDDLVADSIVRFHSCDFTADSITLDELPDTIQGAVYCPGSINLRSFRSLKAADFEQDWQINVMGAIKFLQACQTGLNRAAEMRPSSVVLFSTVAVAQGLPMHASIAAAKGAIEGLTRSLAAEWAPKIRVNAIAPALTETPMAARFFTNDAAREALAARYPLGRTGVAADVAAAAAFLLGEHSSWITGQTLGVDGGMATLKK